MNKSDQRNIIRARINMLSFEQRKMYSKIISATLNDIIDIFGFKNILSYRPFQKEVDISSFNAMHSCYFPVIYGDDMLVVKSEKFILNAYGIEEPIGNDTITVDCLDAVIIPLIGFDDRCNRLGRGKGYYDRFLIQTNACKIAVSFECQKIDDLIFDNNDVKMDIVITEKKIYGRNIEKIKKCINRK